jgi:NADH:quinone reductase (non-electrogenic)
MNAQLKHRIVVVGGGIAGLQVVRGLHRARVEVTLIDRQNFTVFQPLVYQVATGALSPAEVAMPQCALLRRQSNARVLLGEVIGLDLDAGQVTIERRAGAPQRSTVDYDTLVVAGGAHYSYFGHDELRAPRGSRWCVDPAHRARRNPNTGDPGPPRHRRWSSRAT